MYFQRLLYEYEKKMVEGKRNWKELPCKEKNSLKAVVFFGVLLLFSMVLLPCYSFIWWKLLAVISYIGITVSMFLCESHYRRYDENKMECYNSRLENVKKILLDTQYKYYTIECIDIIIEWCDKYSEEDDIWIRLFRPFVTFVTVIFVPVSIVIIQYCIDGNPNWKDVVLIAIGFVLITFEVFLLWYVFGGELKSKLNKKRIMAKNLAEDLRNLKLKEPKIPKNFEEKNKGKKCGTYH